MLREVVLRLGPPKCALMQRGSSIVEFILVLPIFLLIIGGIVDYGLALRNLEVISEAAKHGAQAGALLSFSSLSECNPRCASADHEPLPSCDDGEQIIDCQVTPSSLECLARAQTQDFLLLLGMQPQDWNFEVASCELPLGSSGGGRRIMIRNRVSRAPGASSCLLCLHTFISSTLESAESSFFLSSGCTGYTESC